MSSQVGRAAFCHRLGAVLAEAHVGHRVRRRRRVVGPPGSVPRVVAPEPAVFGASGVAHHDRGSAGRQEVLLGHAAATGRRIGVHLLDHDGAGRDGPRVGRCRVLVGGAVLLHPGQHVRRVPDDDRSVDTVALARPVSLGQGGDEGAGGAHGRVAGPVFRTMTERPQELADLGLVLGEGHRAGQRELPVQLRAAGVGLDALGPDVGLAVQDLALGGRGRCQRQQGQTGAEGCESPVLLHSEPPISRQRVDGRPPRSRPARGVGDLAVEGGLRAPAGAMRGGGERRFVFQMHNRTDES